MKARSLLILFCISILGYLAWGENLRLSLLQGNSMVQEDTINITAEYDHGRVLITRSGQKEQAVTLVRYHPEEDTEVRFTFPKGEGIVYDEDIEEGENYLYFLEGRRAGAVMVDTMLPNTTPSCSIQRGNIQISKTGAGDRVHITELDHIEFPLEVRTEAQQKAPLILTRTMFGQQNNSLLLPGKSTQYWIGNTRCPLMSFFPKDLQGTPEELLPFLMKQEQKATSYEEALRLIGRMEELYHPRKEEVVERDPCLHAQVVLSSEENPIEILTEEKESVILETKKAATLEYCDEMKIEITGGSTLRISTSPTLPRLYLKSGSIRIETPIDTLYSKARIETPHIRITKGRGSYALTHKEIYGKTQVSREEGILRWYDKDTEELHEEKERTLSTEEAEKKYPYTRILFSKFPQKIVLPLSKSIKEGENLIEKEELARLIEEQYIALPKKERYAPQHLLSGKELLELLPSTWKRDREVAQILAEKDHVSFKDWAILVRTQYQNREEQKKQK